MGSRMCSITGGLLAAAFLALAGTGCGPRKAPDDAVPGKAGAAAGTVTLTLASWRKDDVAQMDRILAAFNKTHPGIVVRHEPMESDDVSLYNAALLAQFKAGEGPDLCYLTSFALSRPFWNNRNLASLDNLPGLRENFAPESLAPWASEDGVSYGVPFIATSHGIYYNKTAFAGLGLSPPDTWEGLMDLARRIKGAGMVPFANGSGEPWTMAEIVFMNMAPSFLGGRQGRLDYLAGKRAFNDAAMVALFQAIAGLKPYVSPHEASLGYPDSLQLFLQGKAAMWMGGSWDIPFFESQKPSFEWGVFAVPAPGGGKTAVTFHLDAGIGLNAAGAHPAEAREFLSWIASPESGALLGNELPGFFPMHRKPATLSDAHARDFMDLNARYPTDVRFAWEKISEGSPSAYDLVMEGSIAVLEGKMTARQAADRLAAGLAAWYKPSGNAGR